MSHGKFHWNELQTNDVEAAKKFYAEAVGWSFDEMPMPDGAYWVAMADGQPAGGIMKMPKEVPAGTPPHWMSYLEVDDIDARIAAAKDAKVLMPPMEVDNVGRFALIQDPTGAVIGWITPAAQPDA